MDKEKSCWMKIWSRANVSFNIFKLIQHNFHVASIYSLFHSIFYSYDVILDVRTSNFEWFSKTKTLCKIITMKKSHTSKSKWAWTAAKKIPTIYLTVSKSSTLIQNICLNAYRSSTMSSFTMFWKEPNWCLRFIHSRVLPRRGFSSSESTSSDSITGKSISVAIFDLTSNERMNGLTRWMKHYKLSSNIPPTFIQHFIQHVG